MSCKDRAPGISAIGVKLHVQQGLAVNSVACSKRSDSGECCEVKKAMKSRGGLLLFFRAPFYFAPLPTI